MAELLAAFEQRYTLLAEPFRSTFGRHDLDRLFVRLERLAVAKTRGPTLLR